MVGVHSKQCWLGERENHIVGGNPSVMEVCGFTMTVKEEEVTD